DVDLVVVAARGDRQLAVGRKRAVDDRVVVLLEGEPFLAGRDVYQSSGQLGLLARHRRACVQDLLAVGSKGDRQELGLQIADQLLLLAGRVPEPDRAVEVAGSDVLAVRTPRDAGHALLAALHRDIGLTRLEAPDPGRVVHTDRGELEAVG